MNLEIESTRTKITPSGPKALIQGVYRFRSAQQLGKNSRNVEHDHNPPQLPTTEPPGDGPAAPGPGAIR